MSVSSSSGAKSSVQNHIIPDVIVVLVLQTGQFELYAPLYLHPISNNGAQLQLLLVKA